MATIFDEEDAAVDAEMTEVISKEAVIRAWRRLRHTFRLASTVKDKIGCRGGQPIVIFKRNGDDT